METDFVKESKVLLDHIETADLWLTSANADI